MLRLLGFLLLFSSACQLDAKTIYEFKLRTLDGLSNIHGQIDLPLGAKRGEKYPAVILQGGTAPVDRNYFSTGNGFSGISLIDRLLANGFAVVHYDSRGVYCSAPSCQRCDSVESSVVDPLHYALPLSGQNFLTDADVNILRERNCIFSPESVQRTWANITEDLVVIYQFTKEQDYIDANSINLLGHSEGGVHISQGIQKKYFNPFAVVLLGTPLSSMKRQAYVSFVVRRVEDTKRSIAECAKCIRFIHPTAVNLRGYSTKELVDSWIDTLLQEVYSATTIQILLQNSSSPDVQLAAVDADMVRWIENYPKYSCSAANGNISFGENGTVSGGPFYLSVRNCDGSSTLELLRDFEGWVNIYSFPNDEVVAFFDDVVELDGRQFGKNQKFNFNFIKNISHGMTRLDAASTLPTIDQELIERVVDDLKRAKAFSGDRSVKRDDPHIRIDGKASAKIVAKYKREVNIDCSPLAAANRCGVSVQSMPSNVPH